MKAILFDFFGVLWTPVYSPVINERLPEGERAAWVAKLNDLDIGNIPNEEYERALAVAGNMTEEDMRVAVMETPVPNIELFDYIRTNLVGSHTVGILSNAPRHLIERISSDRLKDFDPILISSDLKMLKPNRDIFEEAARRCGVAPEEILFIDDAEKNVNGAKAVGMNAFLYTDFASFKRTMARYA
ncbi:MAG: HAD-IA family hydrolase [Candidatus Pacebacteria bacterium]|nr:HAD-IA family hydrolase [Candidatus Paceibacterota bacterium]